MSAKGATVRRSGGSSRAGQRTEGSSRAAEARATGGRRGQSTAANLMIDPRIAARRAHVAAEGAAVASRRRCRQAVATIALVVVLGASGLVLLSPLASVRTIKVVGATRTGAPAVRAATELASGPPLVRIDEEQVVARVAALPWVRRATLDRRWPSTVVVSVEERYPAAVAPCLAGSDSTCLVDSDGRVLAPAAGSSSAPSEVPADLPRLAGMPAAGGPGATLPATSTGPLAVAVALPDALRPLVLGVRGEGGEVVLDLRAPGRTTSPPVVRLGPPDRIPDKLTAAATVLARTSVNGVAVLDVRVPESPALTRVRR